MLISVSRKSAEPKSSLKFSKPDELLALLVEDAEEDRPQQRIEEEDPDGDERRSDEDVGLEPRLPLLGEPLDEPVEHEEEEQRAADADRDGNDAVDDLAHDCLLSVRLGIEAGGGTSRPRPDSRSSYSGQLSSISVSTSSSSFSPLVHSVIPRQNVPAPTTAGIRSDAS